jgi:hypothetical protein
MSKRTNVNPDHYKVAGRARPGEALTGNPKEAHALAEAQRRTDQRNAARQGSAAPRKRKRA